jgi:hypothetical protein
MPRTVLALIAALSLLIACEPGYTGGTDQETWTAPDSTPFVSDEAAKFRTSCGISHENYSDPIVYPGQPLASHRHRYAGAVGVDYGTTDIRDHSHSTCEGGTINRTGYWTPAMQDAGGMPVLGLQRGFDDPFQVYYHQSFTGVANELIQWFPEGLRMIAGATMTQTSPKVWWSCLNPGDPRADANHSRGPTIPDCAPGGYVQGSVEFPQCWDGVNLDSPDHRSHMAYGTGWRSNPDPPVTGCPQSHPVPLAAVEIFMRWWVPIEGTPVDLNHPDCLAWPRFNPYDSGWPRTRPDTPDCPLYGEQDPTSTWRLSSDMGAAHGSTFHADWWNGWKPEVGEAIAQGLRDGLDMRMGLVPFPDGVRKLGPAVG